MALFQNLKQYNNIFWLFYKYGQSDLIKEFSSDIDLPQILKEKGDQKGKAEDLVHDLEELGPFYIKLGQILSAEAQFLPEEYDEALQKLQDKAEPMPFKDVESAILKELGEVPDKIFKKFEVKPLSAASLGQVHLAELENGKKVAVKVQRINIQDEILSQLEALESISKFLEEKTEWGKRYHVIEKFQHLRAILLNELDYLKEANNLKILHKNLQEFDKLVVPLPVDQLTTSRVLTMDYVKGEKITDLTLLDKNDLIGQGEVLAKELFSAYLKQILIDGFFQMDPHPGNVYITESGKEHKLVLFDLGMVSHVPFQMQGQLMHALFSINEGHEIELTKTLISLGKKLPDFDEYFLRTKISDLLGNFRDLNLSQMSLGKIVLKLSQIAAESGLWLPIQFSTIGKTLLSLEPVLKALDPKLNPNDLLKENSNKILNHRFKSQFSQQAFYGTLLESVDLLQHLPSKINQLFDLFSQGDYKLKLQLLESETISANFEKVANRITIGLMLAALMIAGALLAQDNDSVFADTFAMAMFILAAIGAVILTFSILWNDRKKKK